MASKADAGKGEKKGMPIVLMMVVMLLGIGGGAGAMWFFAKGAHADTGAAAAPAVALAVPPPAHYIAMDPSFVVNLADPDGTRYLQVDVQLMTRDPAAAPVIQGNLPALRNGLLMLFSQKLADELRSRDDKEALQAEALAEVQRILTAETGRPAAEALYFTSFVTQ
ncbi:flagellar basal body-associated FliL family protein [Coralloluteibacterium thermophilus]|uniref:Flagellar protein FliL n=1 Tax=Coralloluteibacterium thermophilum TaxID=2707049 RepID=A0ABV9NK18_9GAMM